MKRKLSSTEFEQIKKEFVQNDYFQYPTKLGLIKLTPESFEKHFINIKFMDKDWKLTVSKRFFTKLLKIVGISNKAKNLLDKKLFTELINLITYASKDLDVVLLIDLDNRKVIEINSGSRSRLNNKTLFNIADRLLNDDSKLELFEIEGNGHEFNLKLLNTMEMDFGHDENHQFGIVLSNDKLGTSISDFAYRLICSNGMMGVRTDERLRITGDSDKELMNLFEIISNMRNTNYLPHEFEDMIKNAKDIPASLRELDFVVSKLKRMVSVENPDLLDGVRRAYTEKHFPQYYETINRLKGKGYDWEMFDDKELSKIRTDMKVWDMINEMTWIGSHNEPVHLTNRVEMQHEGGKIIKRGFDHTGTQLYFI